MSADLSVGVGDVHNHVSPVGEGLELEAGDVVVVGPRSAGNAIVGSPIDGGVEIPNCTVAGDLDAFVGESVDVDNDGVGGEGGGGREGDEGGEGGRRFHDVFLVCPFLEGCPDGVASLWWLSGGANSMVFTVA